MIIHADRLLSNDMSAAIVQVIFYALSLNIYTQSKYNRVMELSYISL